MSCLKYLGVFSFLALLDLNSAAQSCHPIDQCSCKLDNGKIISLWELDTRSNTKARFNFNDILVDPNSYSYNPCTPITIPNSGCKDALMCEIPKKGGQTASIPLAYPKYPSVTPGVDSSYTFAYTGANGISTNIILQCDATAEQPTILNMVELPLKHFTTTLTSKCACAGGCSYSPSGGSGSPGAKKKLSIGSILCIVLLVLVFVYLVGGLLFYKFHLKKEGSDIIPNKSFWSDLPLLAKDGVVFTYGKIRGTKTEYQPI